VGDEEIQLDVIDFGRPPDGDGRPPRRWLPWVLAGAAVAVAVVFVVQNAYRTTPSATPPTHPPSVSTTQVTLEPSPGSSAPVVTELGHPLLGVKGSWQLFAYMQGGGVVRIDLARGRITQTPVPPIGSSGPVSFLVGPDWTLLRPLDHVPGYVLPDGQPARRTTGALDEDGPVLPGPDPAHMWVAPPQDGPPPLMALVDIDGRQTGTTIGIPNTMGSFPFSDGAGYLLLSGPGGVYEARPDTLRRVTTGGLLAIGPTRWLTLECDERFLCSTVVVDRSTGARRILAGGTTIGNHEPGLISPNGARAALVVSDRAGVSIHLVDLTSGADRRLDIPVNDTYEDLVAWSPDSKWLFTIDAKGRIVPVEAATAQPYALGATLPPVSQVAVRP
jgi:hypothetical protein